MKKPIALIIMDGMGLAPASKANAISLADTSFLDKLWKEYPHTRMHASGELVGLPEGQMGNSEVGHQNLGAGRVVYQSLTRIDKNIKDGEFEKNEVIVNAIETAKERKSSIHILGLVSDGGVHSHINHIIALDKILKNAGLEDINVHAFTDGRDVSPTSGVGFIKTLIENGINVKSISGRYYSMDRDKRWERIQKSWDVLTKGEGNTFTDPVEYIESQYKDDITDEFLVPAINSEKKGLIKDNDVVIIVNFRPDRVRQISHYLIETKINGFNEGPENGRLKDIALYTMMKYEGVDNCKIIFPFVEIKKPIGEIVNLAGLNQIRAAETEKYPHVTFFFDQGKEVQYESEVRILKSSPKVATYDLQPEMSASQITDSLLEELEKKPTDLIILNYANGDMVGHTGVIPAVVKAVETVNNEIKRLYEYIVEKLGGTLVIIADHGNADKMIDENGQPHTAHTTNLVPLIITSKDIEIKQEFLNTKEKDVYNQSNYKAKLGDIAPTLLEMLGVEIPKEMDGNVLISKKK